MMAMTSDGVASVVRPSGLARYALFAVLALVAVYWIGVGRIEFNADDYQYIHSMAPMRGVGDALRPFWSHDANQSFFRPVANMTMAVDFLLFGWNGYAFHLTNLIFHLIATALVFFACTTLFKMQRSLSLIATLFFGLIASHEYNLVVDTARADVLATIFVLASLMFEEKAVHCSNWGLRCAALVCFALAMLSKEIGVMVLPLIAVQYWIRPGSTIRRDWRVATTQLVPYLAVLCLVALYHTEFTAPLEHVQTLTSEGSHSVVAFMRNGAYSIAYLILPVDLGAATMILSRYRFVASVIGGGCVLLLLFAIIRTHGKHELLALYYPLAFSFITGIVALQSFERWRLYLPSVGIVVLAVFVLDRIAGSKHLLRAVLIPVFGMLLFLVMFHLWRGLDAQSNWRESTARMDALKSSMRELLRRETRRPLMVRFVVVPAKLGSATVMQLGQSALVQRAESERLGRPDNVWGVGDTMVDALSSAEVYALDRREGYRGLVVNALSPGVYSVRVPLRSQLMLVPGTGQIQGVARRDQSFKVGDSIMTANGLDVIRSTEGGLIKEIEVHIADSTGLPVAFDGVGFVKLRGRE